MASMTNTPDPGALLWHVFCRVIDNHGDLGVCRRLSAELVRRGHRVHLWVDDARALAWMAPQGLPGLAVHPWDEQKTWQAVRQKGPCPKCGWRLLAVISNMNS